MRRRPPGLKIVVQELLRCYRRGLSGRPPMIIGVMDGQLDPFIVDDLLERGWARLDKSRVILTDKGLAAAKAVLRNGGLVA